MIKRHYAYFTVACLKKEKYPKKLCGPCIGNSAYVTSYTIQLLPHSTLKSKNQKSKKSKSKSKLGWFEHMQPYTSQGDQYISLV